MHVHTPPFDLCVDHHLTILITMAFCVTRDGDGYGYSKTCYVPQAPHDITQAHVSATCKSNLYLAEAKIMIVCIEQLHRVWLIEVLAVKLGVMAQKGPTCALIYRCWCLVF